MEEPNAAQQISALRKGGQRPRALQIGREALRRDPDDGHVRTAVGWCLWEEIKELLTAGNQGGWPTIIRYLKALSKWAHDGAQYGSYSRFDALPLSVTFVMQRELKAERYEHVLEAAEFATPSLLSNLKSGEFPSPRASWLSSVTKAMVETERWDGLLKLETESSALVDPKDGGEWIWYRFSLAHQHTGDMTGALRLFDKAFPQPAQQWQLVARARLLSATERDDEALDHARRALSGSNGAEDLVKLHDALHLIARLLARSEPDRALAHAAIVSAAREAMGFKEDDKLRETIAILGVSSVPPADSTTMAQQQAWWKQAVDARRLSGVVATHLPHGGAGFITGNDGESYYFSKKKDDSRPLIPVGTHVTFEPVKSFDKKKGRDSLRATKVRRA